MWLKDPSFDDRDPRENIEERDRGRQGLLHGKPS